MEEVQDSKIGKYSGLDAECREKGVEYILVIPFMHFCLYLAG